MHFRRIVPNVFLSDCPTLQGATILWAPTAEPHCITLTQIAANCASTCWLPVKSALMYMFGGMLACVCLHCETLRSWIFYVTTQACITGTWRTAWDWGFGLQPDPGGLSYDTGSNVKGRQHNNQIKLCDLHWYDSTRFVLNEASTPGWKIHFPSCPHWTTTTVLQS